MLSRPHLSLRVLALAAASFLLAAAAPARTLTIQNFVEHVDIAKNGTIDVTENIEVHFTGAWNGIYRKIPVKYTTPAGFGYTLFLQPISVTDDAGRALKYQQNDVGRYTEFKIWVPNAADVTRTLVLHYRVLDAISFRFSDHDEFYWNVTGDEWDYPIQSASAHIVLPEGVTGLHAIAYTGVFGSRAQNAEVSINGNRVDIQTNGELGFHEGLTAVVGFDKGFVFPPSAATKIWMFLRSNWPLFLPIITLGLMIWVWWTRGRDPRRNPIAVQYDPPDKLTPGECGTLVDNSVDMRDITATLVDLAVKGYITIEQRQQDGMLHLRHHNDYIFHLKKPASEWNGLRTHEAGMLAGMFLSGSSGFPSFGPGQARGAAAIRGIISAVQSGAFTETQAANAMQADMSVSLSDMQNHFYVHLPSIRTSIMNALVTDGYYTHSPDSVRQGYIFAGAIIGFLIVAGSNFLSGATQSSKVAWIIAGIAVGAIICAFGWFMPAHTEAGERTLEKVLGFEDFLGRVEGDKIERMVKTPELFEKYLPYAMALRVDKKWVQQFSGIAMQPPQWFQGYYGSGFAPYLLMNDLNMMSMQASTAMVSAPRSSGGFGGLGGSGFGGGGGSGGGFGGGGGGGF
ncbi:MAG TPA: DUF2207 domain-containing protein [Candidatus Acidoferrales bacterium]|nr:DUF2207 domain-containing protein [Candidatus Acidoferrales bacterium]